MAASVMTITLINQSSDVNAFLCKATVGQVKDVLQSTKCPSYNEQSRIEMLRYLCNQNKVGEGNEWLHGDNALWRKVEDEAYSECSPSYKNALNNCVAILMM